MAKINIVFNNKSYSIDESVLASAIAELDTVLNDLSSGGSNSNDVYIDGDYVNWESLGETWADSRGYTVCQDCGFQGYIYGMNGYAVIDKCWDCTGGGTYYLMDESGNYVDYNSPVAGGLYSIGDYADPYLYFYIDDVEVSYGSYYDEPWCDIAFSIGRDCPYCGDWKTMSTLDGYVGFEYPCQSPDDDCSGRGFHYLITDDGEYVREDDSAIIGGNYSLTTQEPV